MPSSGSADADSRLFCLGWWCSGQQCPLPGPGTTSTVSRSARQGAGRLTVVSQLTQIRQTAGMAGIIPLHQPDTASYLRNGLIEDGFVTVPVADLTVSVEVWRQIARTVARDLGRPVRTMLVGSDVTALLSDYPRDDVERARLANRMRATSAAMPAYQEHPLGWLD